MKQKAHLKSWEKTFAFELAIKRNGWMNLGYLAYKGMDNIHNGHLWWNESKSRGVRMIEDDARIL